MKPFFTLEAVDPETGARAGRLHTDHGEVLTPVFMPVGTQAAVKTLTAEQLEDLDAQIILANTYHLYLRPGAARVAAAGGVHGLAAWRRALLSDSGGYQFYSLRELNTVSEEGVGFRSHLDGSKHFLSPEDVIDVEAALGADIVMPLDECLPYPSEPAAAAAAAARTARWARRCRDRKGPVFRHHAHRQFLFGIVQGASYEALRRESAAAITDLDLPGYAIGGLAVGEPKTQLLDLTALCTSLLPADRPRYLMGVGFPEDLLRCVALGVDMFDCVMPTRNARKGTLFTRAGRLVVRNAAYAEDANPPEAGCACPCCRRYSRAYLRHLIHAGEPTGMTLATLHNLYFYLDLMRAARGAILEGRYGAWLRAFFADYAMASD